MAKRSLGQPPRVDTQQSLVGFIVGDVHYAIDITRVHEIVNPLEITVLPHTPPEVAGVADHRGTVLPVIRLRTRFGLEEVEATRSTKWILLRPHAVGLVVDAVTEVFPIMGSIQPAPPVGGASDLRGITGVVTHGKRLIFVLDVDRFIELALSLAATDALSEVS